MPELVPIRFGANLREGMEEGRRSVARGRAAAYASGGDYDRAADELIGVDDERARAYRGRGDLDFTREYAGAIAGGEFNRAEKLAGQRGSIEGVTGAQSAATQLDQQQRERAWRAASRYVSALEGIEAMPETERQPAWESLRTQARAEASGPGGDWIDQLPTQYTPRLSGMLRTRLTDLRNSLLTPEQAATLEMTARQRDIQERQAEIAERRADAAETTAQAAMMRAERSGGGGVGGMSNEQFDRANSLRDEYNAQTSSYRTVADIAQRSEEYMRRLQTNPGAASGQGDVGLVYALAKIYDPTSVVREGEFATMARQGGYGEQMRSWVLQAQGRGFSPTIRNQIMTEVRNGLAAATRQRDQTRTRYETQARRSGIDPVDVIDDYQGGTSEAPAPGGANQPRPDPLGIRR